MVSESAPDFRERKSGGRFEAVVSALFRSRSQKYVPLETAALSVAFLHYAVPHAAWDAVGSTFHQPSHVSHVDGYLLR